MIYLLDREKDLERLRFFSLEADRYLRLSLETDLKKMFLTIFIICHRQMCGAKTLPPKKQKQTKNKRQMVTWLPAAAAAEAPSPWRSTM